MLTVTITRRSSLSPVNAGLTADSFYWQRGNLKNQLKWKQIKYNLTEEERPVRRKGPKRNEKIKNLKPNCCSAADCFIRNGFAPISTTQLFFQSPTISFIPPSPVSVHVLFLPDHRSAEYFKWTTVELHSSIMKKVLYSRRNGLWSSLNLMQTYSASQLSMLLKAHSVKL